jgi:predicted aconitase with swiveling domain
MSADGETGHENVRSLVGQAFQPVRGPALVLDEPLSFWGGVDPIDGRIVDRHHPQHGRSVTEQVLFVAKGRGSSSGSSILTEMARLGTAPTAIVLDEADEILALGAIVADELYRRAIPVVVRLAAEPATVNTGDRVVVEGDRLRY